MAKPKPTLTDALARKSPPPVEPAPAPITKTAKVAGERTTTTLTLDREMLVRLKALAVRQHVRVNAVILDAIENHLAIHARDTAA